MIEFCTKRRMAAAIVGLASITVIALIIENRVSLKHSMKDHTESPGNISKPCWEYMKTEVLEACAPCSQFEIKIQPSCKRTGYKEKISCIGKATKETQTLYKSCPKQSRIEERNFWVFESVIAVVGLAAYCMVLGRQKHLNKLLLDKVNRQIAAGV